MNKIHYGLDTRKQGTKGYLAIRKQTRDGGPILEHVLIAERALGKPLPKGAEIHHADENKGNNTPSNLVICPDREYHKLLHRRMRAKKACGNANWIQCYLCGKYDEPTNLMPSPKNCSRQHHQCNNEYSRQRYRNNKQVKKRTREYYKNNRAVILGKAHDRYERNKIKKAG